MGKNKKWNKIKELKEKKARKKNNNFDLIIIKNPLKIFIRIAR